MHNSSAILFWFKTLYHYKYAFLTSKKRIYKWFPETNKQKRNKQI